MFLCLCIKIIFQINLFFKKNDDFGLFELRKINCLGCLVFGKIVISLISMIKITYTKLSSLEFMLLAISNQSNIEELKNLQKFLLNPNFQEQNGVEIYKIYYSNQHSFFMQDNTVTWRFIHQFQHLPTNGCITLKRKLKRIYCRVPSEIY